MHHLLRCRTKAKRNTPAIKIDTDRSDLQLSDGQTVTVDAIAPDDTSIISVPPKVFASTKDAVRRASPPRSQLEKHKHTSSSRDSLDLESGLPAVVTEQRQSALLPSQPAYQPPTTSAEAKMELNIAAMSPETHDSSKVEDPHADESEVPARRTTRSESRRHSRVDSHDFADVTATSHDNAKNTSGTDVKDFVEVSAKKFDVPRSLSIRKLDTSRSPSPRSPLDSEVPQVPPLSPARKSTSFFGSSPSPDENSPNLSQKSLKSLIPAKPRNSPTAYGPDAPPKGATMKERLAFARARPASPPLDDESMKVAVRPPVYDMSKGLYQWTSDLPSTSRPDRPWEWPKRWTCCRCEATTIVEQKVCSSLSCSHYRCPNDCRMIRVARPAGQFMPSGGF